MAGAAFAVAAPGDPGSANRFTFPAKTEHIPVAPDQGRPAATQQRVGEMGEIAPQ
jgi:hypothetical protein